MGKDGSTAYERMKEKRSKMLGFEFAESVHFRSVAPPGILAKLENLWQTGIVVGCRSNSGKFMVSCTCLVTFEGSHQSRDGIRMPSRG